MKTKSLSESSKAKLYDLQNEYKSLCSMISKNRTLGKDTEVYENKRNKVHAEIERVKK